MQFHDEAGRRIFRYRSKGAAIPVDAFDEERAVDRYRRSITLATVVFAGMALALGVVFPIFFRGMLPSWWLPAGIVGLSMIYVAADYRLWRDACAPIFVRTPVGVPLGRIGELIRWLEQIGWSGLMVAAFICGSMLWLLPDFLRSASRPGERWAAIAIASLLGVVCAQLLFMTVLKLMMGVRTRRHGDGEPPA